MKNDLKESLQKCRIKGTTVFLPKDVLPNYPAVKKALMDAGSAYKRNTFVFPGDAQPYMDRLLGGEKVNLKKEFQFYATPHKLADRLVELAAINENHTILEPSAGHGAIIHAIHRATGTDIEVDYFELMPENQDILGKKILQKEIYADFQGHDFLSYQENPKGCKLYDRIIANPPFTKNADIDHIKRMYDCLKPGGRIVSIASIHWQISQRSEKEKMFKAWLEKLGAEIHQIASGEFKESGTQIASCIIVIDKKLK